MYNANIYVLQVLQCNSNSIGPTSKFKWLKWAHIEVAANKSTQTAKQFIMEEVCSVSPALHYHTGTCTQTQTHTHPHTLLTVSNLLWSGPLECSNSCRLNVTEESTLAVIYEPSKGLHSNLTNTWNNIKLVTGDHNSLAGTHGWSSHASPGKPGCLRCPGPCYHPLLTFRVISKIILKWFFPAWYVAGFTNQQTNKPTNQPANKQASKQTNNPNKQVERQTDRQTDR
jgi:hypothetical protein